MTTTNMGLQEHLDHYIVVSVFEDHLCLPCIRNSRLKHKTIQPVPHSSSQRSATRKTTSTKPAHCIRCKSCTQNKQNINNSIFKPLPESLPQSAGPPILPGPSSPPGLGGRPPPPIAAIIPLPSNGMGRSGSLR